MEKEFIPYEQALALKELGFDEPCLGVYYESKTFYIYTKSKGVKNSDKTSQSWVFTAPTFSQAFRWFRETYNLHSCVAPVYEDEINKVILYWFWIQGFDSFEDEDINYKTPEEAELACLNKLIEIVKNGKS
jgi:hypothetical protein